MPNMDKLEARKALALKAIKDFADKKADPPDRNYKLQVIKEFTPKK